MAGPWEKYQQQQPAGPWQKYGSATDTQAAPSQTQGPDPLAVRQSMLTPLGQGIRQMAPYATEPLEGFGRGLMNTAGGLYQAVRHPIDTAVGLDKQLNEAYDASKQSRASGEGLAGQTLSFLEKAPVVGSAVRYGEQGGPSYYPTPKSLGAGAELSVYGAAPKVIGGLAKGAGKAVSDYRAGSGLNEAIANAEGMSKQAKTLNVIDKGAQAIFNQAKTKVQLLQGKLKSDAQAAIQPAIEADRAAGSKPLIPTKAVLDVHKAMEATGYVPTRQEQALLDGLGESPEDGIAKKLGFENTEMAKASMGAVIWSDIVNKGGPVKRGVAEPGFEGGGLTLDKALQLRSAIGSAAAKARRAGNAKANMVLTNAYEGMNDSINGRLNELEGKAGAVDSSGKPTSNKAFEQYNKNHKAAFELEDGFTAKLMDNTLDHHEARQKLGDFVNANLTQVTKQMRDKGINPQEFQRLQSDAQKTLAAHDAVMGKFNKSLYRQVLSGTPGEAMLPLSVMMMMKGAGLYGMAPYMAATLMGKVSGNAARMNDFAHVLRRLDVSDKVLNTRTQPGPLDITQFPGPSSPTPAGTGGGGEPSPPPASASPRDLIGEEAETRLGTAQPPEPLRPQAAPNKLGTPEENKRIQAAMEGRGEKKQALESKDKAAAIRRAKARRAGQ